MAREFIVPGEIISGSGALDMAENALKLLCKKALIVTDKVMIDLGNCAKVEKALTNQGIEYSIYSDICGEPTDTMIEKGLQIYKDENCDFLVALGGGNNFSRYNKFSCHCQNLPSVSTIFFIIAAGLLLSAPHEQQHSPIPAA